MTANRRSLLLHPVALVALGVLVANDHWLKAAAPGLLTGKLSDVAGLVVAPLLLAELAAATGRRAGTRPARVTVGVAAAAAAAVAIGFALVKLTAAGSLAFAWGLGTVQWLAGLAWLRGDGPLPVAIVRDPTDLVALPAVLVAAGLAARAAAQRPRPAPAAPGRATRWAGAAVAVVAGVAAIATSQAAYAEDAVAEAEASIPAGRGAAAWRVAWVSGTGQGADANGMLDVVASVGGGGAADVRLVLVPAAPLPAGCATAEAATRSVLSLGPGCDAVATGEAVAILERGAGDDGSDAIEGRLTAEFTVSSTRASTVEGAEPAVQLAGLPVADAPSSVGAAADGLVDLSPDDRAPVRQAWLRVPAAALADPLAFPLVGRMTLTATAVDGGILRGAQAWAQVGGGGEERFLDETPIEVDWLGLCRPGEDCVVPVTLRFRRDDTEPPPDDVAVRWLVEARLVAYDGRPLPPIAFELP